jgi:hypothetical protein
MINVVFVAPFFLPTTLRFVSAAAAQPGARVALVSQDPADRLPGPLRARLAAHRRVPDGLDGGSLESAVRDLGREIGGVDRLIGALEDLQVPLGEVRDRLGIAGMGAETARNFRDKARMKTVLTEAGVPCARHRLAGSDDAARTFVDEVGFPVVVKPPAGAGARNTARLESESDLEECLRLFSPTPPRPLLIEEFVTGREHSFDAVCLDGRVVWHSLTRYDPAPLTVLENPWIQWCVLLPREVDHPRYEDIRKAAAQALSALGMGTGLAHMEWFRLGSGGIAISEVGARPPGAQFITLMSYAHDHDFYQAWARLVIHHEFDPPPRRFAAGAAYLRGQGQGRVRAVHGLDEAQRELGPLVVEARLPRPGQAATESYEGEGYVILRHPETSVVERGLARLVELVRVELR